MDNKKLFEKIRGWESEIAYANPVRAAVLSRKIARGKGRVFHQ
jgi:hypothetical protein